MQPEKYVGRAPRQVEKYLAEVIQPILDENADLLGVTAEINV
jgi:adenylosuccinate lyase